MINLNIKHVEFGSQLRQNAVFITIFAYDAFFSNICVKIQIFQELGFFSETDALDSKDIFHMFLKYVKFIFFMISTLK